MEESSMGSSPHTRDKYLSNEEITDEIGITPAYAGQMHFFLLVKVGIEDHPRIRGTNRLLIPWRRTISGSPPHTRDKLLSGSL